MNYRTIFKEDVKIAGILSGEIEFTCPRCGKWQKQMIQLNLSASFHVVCDNKEVCAPSRLMFFDIEIETYGAVVSSDSIRLNEVNNE